MTNSQYLQKFVRMQEHKLKAKVNAFQAERLRSQLDHTSADPLGGESEHMAAHHDDRSHHHSRSRYFDFIATPERR